MTAFAETHTISMKLTISMRRAVWFSSLVSALWVAGQGCNRGNADSGNISPGITIEQSRMGAVYEQIAKAMTSAPPRGMKGGGVAGVLGGVRAKVLTAGAHEVLLSLPQLTETQIPLCYAIATTPREAGTQYRLRQRAGSNIVVSVQLNGSQGQEVQINWSALILLVDKPGSPDGSPAEPYLRETACVQSGDKRVKALADRLWPVGGKIGEYAGAIQEFIRSMKQEKQPCSMDALGILESGGNWICTANANLAAALLRAKNIPCRSIAVVPTTGSRLEMHRIVEYFDAGQWSSFDPSSLQKSIPLKPWQNIIMARTTIADEELAMKPRMCSSLGCPYAQEIEFLDGGVSLWGNDFFWTMGKPLAEFGASDKAIVLVKNEWNRFLGSGELSQAQLRLATATNAAGFLEALETK